MFRNLNINEARDMLVSTLRWRESFNVEAAMKEEFPRDIFGQVGHNFGHDKAGRPVVYVAPASRRYKQMTRWRNFVVQV
jgi:phosphatidylinositol transfer protein SFH5